MPRNRYVVYPDRVWLDYDGSQVPPEWYFPLRSDFFNFEMSQASLAPSHYRPSTDRRKAGGIQVDAGAP